MGKYPPRPARAPIVTVRDRPLIVRAADRLRKLAEVRTSAEERAEIARGWEQAREEGR
jgi:hypothetical protein